MYFKNEHKSMYNMSRHISFGFKQKLKFCFNFAMLHVSDNTENNYIHIYCMSDRLQNCVKCFRRPYVLKI